MPHSLDKIAEQDSLHLLLAVVVLERRRVDLLEVALNGIVDVLDGVVIPLRIDFSVKTEHRKHKLFPVTGLGAAIVLKATARKLALEGTDSVQLSFPA